MCGKAGLVAQGQWLYQQSQATIHKYKCKGGKKAERRYKIQANYKHSNNIKSKTHINRQ
jgi:hypothetical protein